MALTQDQLAEIRDYQNGIRQLVAYATARAANNMQPSFADCQRVHPRDAHLQRAGQLLQTVAAAMNPDAD